MPTFDILEAGRQLSRLVDALETGAESEIMIARNGRPVARLVAISTPVGQRIGVARGRFVVPDTIDQENPAIDEQFVGQPE